GALYRAGARSHLRQLRGAGMDCHRYDRSRAKESRHARASPENHSSRPGSYSGRDRRSHSVSMHRTRRFHHRRDLQCQRRRRIGRMNLGKQLQLAKSLLMSVTPMRIVACLLLLLASVSAQTNPALPFDKAQAANAKHARELVDKAIQALGGQAYLSVVDLS